MKDSNKKFKYVYYKFTPVLVFAEAKSEQDLRNKIYENEQKPPGVLFVELENEKDCIKWKIPRKTISKKDLLSFISYVEEIKEEE
jgi:hypothetical protein